MNEKKDLYRAYDCAQNSTIIQMLLEICDGDLTERPCLEEIRRIACSQIHDMFIADVTFAKLVHFQVSFLHRDIFKHSLLDLSHKIDSHNDKRRTFSPYDDTIYRRTNIKP